VIGTVAPGVTRDAIECSWICRGASTTPPPRASGVPSVTSDHHPRLHQRLVALRYTNMEVRVVVQDWAPLPFQPRHRHRYEQH
jgi:hypothetical protein